MIPSPSEDTDKRELLDNVPTDSTATRFVSVWGCGVYEVYDKQDDIGYTCVIFLFVFLFHSCTIIINQGVSFYPKYVIRSDSFILGTPLKS